VLVALSPQSFFDLASVYKFPASKADDLQLYLPAFEVYEAVIFSAAFLVFHLLIFYQIYLLRFFVFGLHVPANIIPSLKLTYTTDSKDQPTMFVKQIKKIVK